jgi:adhesin transport system membrane fusion protein
MNASTKVPKPAEWSMTDLQKLSEPIPVDGGKRISEADLDFVTNARALVSRNHGHDLRGWLPWLSVVLVALLAWWSSWAELEEVTRGIGKVIPSKSVQLIQSLEGGIVDKILVEEGQAVQEGQELMRIQDAIYDSAYQENISRKEVIEARIARLKAEADHADTVKFPEVTRSELTAIEQKLFESRRADYLTTESSLKERLDLARQEEVPLIEGTKTKAVSLLELIRVQKEIATLQGELSTLRTKYERLAMEEYDKNRSELEALIQAIKRDKDRLDRTVIMSPVRGIVNKIHINTIGRVIGSGEDIMEIVPADDTLLIEANIRPSDIAFVRPGQNAKVRFTAYDFAVYGSLDGKVERIGVDTVTAPNSGGGQEADVNASYYSIRVRTDSNTLGRDRRGEDLAIIPGMVSEVDIVTGKKTILSYLLRPFNRAMERALRER